VYETFMLGNQQADPEARLEALSEAIRRVYASTFSRHAKAYVRATPYRLEEEKMAVILQQVVGTRHGERFYPDFSGVVRSRNYYPVPPMTFEDGIAAVALGLGRAVVDGGKCLTFCPRYPQNLVQFSSVEDILANSQSEFWALELHGAVDGRPGHWHEKAFRPGCRREADGTLRALASTYSRDNNAVYDGVSRPGSRIVTFAPMLKHGTFRWRRFSMIWFGPAKMRWAIPWRSNLPCVCRGRRRGNRAGRRVWFSANPPTHTLARHRGPGSRRCAS
jgi:hypothetical protein